MANNYPKAETLQRLEQCFKTGKSAVRLPNNGKCRSIAETAARRYGAVVIYLFREIEVIKP